MSTASDAEPTTDGGGTGSGVSEWRAEQIRAGKALADELNVPMVANQPHYSARYRVIEAEVIPTRRDRSQLTQSPNPRPQWDQ